MPDERSCHPKVAADLQGCLRRDFASLLFREQGRRSGAGWRMPKRALITGITGQDGSYLAEFLLARSYEVHGIIRRASTFNTGRLEHIYQDPHDPQARLHLVY